MVSVASPIITQALKNPIDQAKDTGRACLDALDQFANGKDPKAIAGNFVHAMKQIWDIDQDPKLHRTMGATDGITAALGLYAKVFKLGLDIAYGAEPNTALN